MPAGRQPVLTPGQSRAYALYAAGLSTADAATVMGKSVDAVAELLFQGAQRLGVSGRAAGLRALRAGGWTEPPLLADLLAENYKVVGEVYRAAPVDRRDDMLIGDLYRLVVTDLLKVRT